MLHLSRSIPGVASVLIASVVTLSVWLSINSPLSVQAASAGRSLQAGIVSTCDEPSFKSALAGGRSHSSAAGSSRSRRAR